MPSRQRIVVLEFPDDEQAQAWDEAGQPLDDLCCYGGVASVALPPD